MRIVCIPADHSLWSRLFCGPLKMRRVPEKAVFGTEYLFRTVEACFLHRMLPKMRRVPQEAFLSTARIFRTVGGRFWYRVLSHICYRFFPMSYYSMFYIPPCILSFASILYYATKASKGNVAISEFRFGMVLVSWLTKYVLMAFYSFL